MKNKELIDLLTAYYMRSDPKDVALSLAGVSLDIVRFMMFDRLPHAEAECLMKRSSVLIDNLHEFLKNPNRKPLKVTRLRSEDTDWEDVLNKRPQ